MINAFTMPMTVAASISDMGLGICSTSWIVSSQGVQACALLILHHQPRSNLVVQQHRPAHALMVHQGLCQAALPVANPLIRQPSMLLAGMLLASGMQFLNGQLGLFLLVSGFIADIAGQHHPALARVLAPFLTQPAVQMFQGGQVVRHTHTLSVCPGWQHGLIAPVAPAILLCKQLGPFPWGVLHWPSTHPMSKTDRSQFRPILVLLS